MYILYVMHKCINMQRFPQKNDHTLKMLINTYKIGGKVQLHCMYFAVLNAEGSGVLLLFWEKPEYKNTY